MAAKDSISYARVIRVTCGDLAFTSEYPLHIPVRHLIQSRPHDNHNQNQMNRQAIHRVNLYLKSSTNSSTPGYVQSPYDMIEKLAEVEINCRGKIHH